MTQDIGEHYMLLQLVTILKRVENERLGFWGCQLRGEAPISETRRHSNIAQQTDSTSEITCYDTIDHVLHARYSRYCSCVIVS